VFSFNQKACTVPVLSKRWGTNRCIFSDANFEVHHAQIFAGGYSSRHHHRAKVNDFYLVEGTLKVIVYDAAGNEIQTVTLNCGDRFSVHANVEHRFEAITDVELIETYWVSLDPSDIVRADEGGITPKKSNVS